MKKKKFNFSGTIAFVIALLVLVIFVPINLITGYFTKVKDAILDIVNANLLQKWAKYEIGENVVQTAETKWRLFIIAFGPHLIFDLISLLPMLLYNIDKNTRDRMYRDLEITRAARAQSELLKFAEDGTGENAQ